MIHFFDGFNWPVDALPVVTPTALVDYKDQPPSAFVVPREGNRSPSNGKGAYGSRYINSGTANVVGNRFIARKSVSLAGGKLVVGGTFTSNQVNVANAFVFGLTSTSPIPETHTSGGSSFVIPACHLPSLLVNETEIILRKSSASGAIGTGLVTSRSMTGISSTTRHWYEVVYDTAANTVEVFIDDVSVLVYPYTFTAEEKSTEYTFFFSMSVRGHNAECLAHVLYAGDERLGPCKVVAKYVSSDVNVPAAFGDAPNHPKLNGGFLDSDVNKLSTKENATAKFGLNGDQISTAVKALAITGRLSSTNRSAYETDVKVKYGLDLPQGAWTSEGRDVPAPSIATHKIDQLVVQNNPITSAPFTPAEVNALGLSLTFDITNKF